jgi:hypothetical protein
MTVTKLETLVLRNVVTVRILGERVELSIGTAGQVMDQTQGSGNSPYQNPSQNPWTSATSSAGSTCLAASAALPDAMPDADAAWPGAGRSLVEGRTFGSRRSVGLSPAAGGQVHFRHQPMKSTGSVPRVKATGTVGKRTGHRRTGNTSVGG